MAWRLGCECWHYSQKQEEACSSSSTSPVETPCTICLQSPRVVLKEMHGFRRSCCWWKGIHYKTRNMTVSFYSGNDVAPTKHILNILSVAATCFMSCSLRESRDVITLEK